MERRSFLALSCAGMTSVAGCSDSDTTSTSESTQSSTETPPEPTPTPTPSEPMLYVSELDHPSAVDHDESFTVTSLVKNNGMQGVDGELELEIGDLHTDSIAVSLEANQSSQFEFNVDPLDSFSSDEALRVSSPDNTMLSNLSVKHPNPYNQDVLILGLEQESSARHDIDEIIAEAIEYWEANAMKYAGYDIEFDYQPNAENPDIQLTLVDEIVSCGYHTGEIMGCATLVQSEDPEDVQIELVATYRREWTTSTLKHEIGHTLGLTHDDEPAYIMSNEAEDLIPDYKDRTLARDFYFDAISLIIDATNTWQEAVDAVSEERYKDAEEWAEEGYNSASSANSNFEDAATLSNQLDESEANDIASAAAEQSEHVMDGLYSAYQAARAYQRGAYRTGDSHANDANSSIGEFDFDAIADYSDFSASLGFPEHR